ncbi:MAG: hypothetical protein ACI4T6_11825 [Candidatus Flemingiibacterium sp.]
MSIQTELARLTNAKAAIQAAIEGKGVTVPDGTLLDGMASLIEGIEAGGGGIVLPSGHVMDSGTFVLTEDSTAYSFTIGHKYAWYNRAESTFCALMALSPISGTAMIDGAFSQSTVTSKIRFSNYLRKSDDSLVSNVTEAFIGFSTNSKSGYLRIKSISGYPIKAGVTYFWIVIGEMIDG